ncbi:hypothetical protein D1BOALGB6SA_10170 [Olavius sp. associated proteobacterium Delta 1]|nr:hypothetical protein D1BOALGB6SA_10170 [Olavius sp. associated proteobacterium Delta 1]
MSGSRCQCCCWPEKRPAESKKRLFNLIFMIYWNLKFMNHLP